MKFFALDPIQKLSLSFLAAFPKNILAQNLIVTILYVLSGLFGLSLAIPPGYATAIWPPSGIALGALLISGKRVLPGVAAGSLIVNLWITYSNGSIPSPLISFLLCLTIALGASIQALLGEKLVRRLVGNSIELTRAFDVLKFFVLASPVSSVVSATVGTLALLFFGVINESAIKESWLTWWYGDTMGVIIMTPIILSFFGKPKFIWRKRIRQVSGPLIGVFLLTTVAFQQTISRDQLRLEKSLQEQVDSIYSHLSIGISGYFNILKTLTAFYLSQSDGMSLPEFQKFTREILGSFPGVHAISWNPVVTQKERAAFEKIAGKENRIRFEITELDAKGNFIRATPRDKYVAIKYIEPVLRHSRVLGYDINSDQIRNEALTRANELKTEVASHSLKLIQFTEDPGGILLIHPVFPPPKTLLARKVEPIGYFVAVVRLSDMFETVLGDHLRNTDVTIKIESLDGTLVFENPTSTQKSSLNLGQRRQLTVASGIEWTLQVDPTETFLSKNTQIEGRLVLGGGILFANLLGIFLFVLGGRNEALQLEVSKRSKLESAFRESENRKVGTFEASLDSIVSINQHGEILEFNSAAEITFGRKKMDVIGKNVTEVIMPKRFHAAHLAGISKYLETGKGQIVGKRLEMSAMRSDGTEFPIEISVVALTQEGQPCFTAFMRDITDRHLNESNLKLAKEAAESANLAKSTFLANMSHEIRTPLTAIIGFSELIASQNLTEEARIKFVDKIRKNGFFLTHIINEVLDLSKVEANQMKVEKQKTSIRELISDVIATLSEPAKDKGIILSYTFDSSVPMCVFTDSSRLRQVMLNLVGNALKFTMIGSINVYVCLNKRENENSQLSLTISDTGIGISQSDSKSLFQYFSQVDGSMTREYGGSGLGLALSKKLAQLLGGDVILAKSLPGVGSTFIVTIDAGAEVENSSVPVSPPHLENNHANPKGWNLKGLKVLLAEDSEDNQILFSEILKIAGAQVDIAENGKVALEKARTCYYDLYLIDIQMPIIDGYAVVKNLRLAGVENPIFALTAHALNSDREQCLNAGFTEHIIKPLEPDRLFKTISEHINL